MSKVQGIKDRNIALDRSLNWESLRWIEAADTWFDSLPSGYQYTADDLVEAIGLPSKDGKNGAIGAKMKSWNREGVARGLSYTSTARTTSHARPVMLWEKQ